MKSLREISLFQRRELILCIMAESMSSLYAIMCIYLLTCCDEICCKIFSYRSCLLMKIQNAGSKIVFANGSQDPWRHASKQTSSTDSEFLITWSKLYIISLIIIFELQWVRVLRSQNCLLPDQIEPILVKVCINIYLWKKVWVYKDLNGNNVVYHRQYHRLSIIFWLNLQRKFFTCPSCNKSLWTMCPSVLWISGVFLLPIDKRNNYVKQFYIFSFIVVLVYSFTKFLSLKLPSAFLRHFLS